MIQQNREIMKEETNVAPAEMFRQAIASKADLSQLRELLELQKEWEANEARKAYHLAMAEFKATPLKVIKDKKNKQYGSMYTTLGNLINTVNPELSKYGLSARWDIYQNGTIQVICIMTHKQGHSEKTSATAPADTSGAKNAIQQIKSTITYLKAVTFESLCGLASTDANFDDDGNGSGKQESRQEEAPKRAQRFAPPPEPTPEIEDAECEQAPAEPSESITQEELSALIEVAVSNKWLPAAIEEQFGRLGYKLKCKMKKSLKLTDLVDPMSRWDYESILESVSKQSR